MYRRKPDNSIEVLIAHPGGPFYANKDNLYWSIPKGEIENENDLLGEAIREFKEETGNEPEQNRAKYIELGSVKQKSGKIVHAWAFEGELQQLFKSNGFEMEWPPRSGKLQRFPEIDKLEFFEISEAGQKLNPEQAEFLTRLASKLN